MRTIAVVALLMFTCTHCLVVSQCSERLLSQAKCPQTYIDALTKAGESSKVKADVPRVCTEREMSLALSLLLPLPVLCSAGQWPA
jgi:hypothetical protein